ncbi:MAG TPA: ubiquinol-cytochrome c reductase iron-sulfur subunit [Terracidiphilus sp.]|nr:ubiquinol-cytochrome c reductase iron-sulfur subunit [Terracidiphilus sp.]
MTHPQEPLSASPKSAALKPESEARAAQISRRAFLFKLSVALNGVVGAVLAVPLVGYLLGPALRRDQSYKSWVSLGPIGNFPEGETRLADYVNPVTSVSDGETAKVACWVRRMAGSKFQVFAINCAHLGCPVRWFPQSHLFMCPCHGGAYYEDGSRASGPPERGLFEYKYSIVGGKLMIDAGQMPTLSNEACNKKPLIQIESQRTRSDA